MKRKTISLILILAMIFTMLPGTAAFAGSDMGDSSEDYEQNVETLITGPEINAKMKYLSGTMKLKPEDWYVNNLYGSSAPTKLVDESIRAFRRSEEKPDISAFSEENIISGNQAEDVYIWYEEGTIYWWSENAHPQMNPDAAGMFFNLRQLQDISGLKDFDTSKAVTMEAMFMQTIRLKDYAPVADWDVSSVVDMQRMLNRDYEFYKGFDEGDDSYKLTDLTPFSDWDVSNVRFMNNMFQGNQYLSDLTPLRNWDTGDVVDFSYCFNHLHALASLDGLENWDVSACTDMGNMFQHGHVLKDLSALAGWDTSNVLSMRGMFRTCSVEELTPLSGWDTSNVRLMGGYDYTCGMFSNDAELHDISPLASWDVSNVTSMGCMFENCISLESVKPLENWKTDSLQETRYMFDNASLSSLEGLESFDMSHVMDAGFMFYRTKIRDVKELSGWKLSSMIDMTGMFSRCASLQDISGIASWKFPESAAALNELFKDDETLEDASWLSRWDLEGIRSLNGLFSGTALREDAYPEWDDGEWVDGSFLRTGEKARKDIAALESWNESPNANLPSSTTISWNGYTATRTVKLMDEGRQLKAATEEEPGDYIIRYLNNGKPGRVYMLVEGTGEYRGIYITSFLLSSFPASIYDAEVEGLEDAGYTGQEIRPDIKVSYFGRELKEGSDYFVKFINNVEEGTCKVIIAAYSATDRTVGSCSGVLVKYFRIRKNMKLSDITLSSSSYVYDGKEKKPKVTVKYIDGSTAVAGKDYEVIYKENIKAGTAKVTVKGKGDYIYSVTKEYTIKSRSIKSMDAQLSYDSTVYTGKEKKPSVTVTDSSGNMLKKYTDFTVSYEDNVNAGSAEIIIQGMGNYTGNIRKNFVIERKSLDDYTLGLEYDTAVYSGKKNMPSVTVKDGNGKALKEGRDYSAEYDGGIDAGTAAVMVTGTGNYTGMLTKAYTVEKRSIEGLKKSLSKNTYIWTGKYIKPSVTISLGGSKLKSGTDYTVSYRSNKSAGTAEIVIRGRGNFNGTAIETFRIQPKKAVVKSLTAGKKKLKVKMESRVSEAGGTYYQLAYKMKGTKTWKYKKSRSGTVTVKALKKGKKYQVKVRAYKESKGKKYYGAWSSVKTGPAVK